MMRWPTAYASVHATIDGYDRTREVGRLTLRKEHRDFRRLSSRTHAAHQNLCISLLA
jgi:hypothetical protein